MHLKRITYAAMLIALFACALFTGNRLFALLGAACIALLPVSLVLFCRAVQRIQLRIDLPESAAKNVDFPARIQIGGGKWIYGMRIHLEGQITNLLCGETVPISAPAHSPCTNGAALAITLNSPRCGKLSLEIFRLKIIDPLGLFSRRISMQAHAATLILPDPFDIAVTLTAHDLPFPESDDYSPDRAGNDPSELFGIRDYREGDALKIVHWKLSEKYDRTVVREASLPVSHAILLLLDNCPQRIIDPDAACCACEALISCSLALADAGIYHRIAWISRETGMLESHSIASGDDLYGEQGALLSARIMHDDAGLLSRLADQEALEYSHLLIFAAAEPQGVSALEGRVTLLQPETDTDHAICCLRDTLTHLVV